MNFNKAEFDKAFGISAQLPKSDKPEVVFSGRSNVGKSSLLNRLFGRKNLARVSAVPGKTITINFYNVDNQRFVDLPGYGYAKISKAEKSRFAELMEGYFQGGRNIALVVQLIDMRHKPTADDYGMLEFLKQSEIPFIVALTKADKLKPTQYKLRLEEIEAELADYPCTYIPFSAETGKGSDEVKAEIVKAISAAN